MKNFKLLLASLLISSATFAQTSVDEVELIERKVETRQAVDGTIYKTKHIVETERVKPVVLLEEDKYELNQTLKQVPVNVTKKIMLDFDRDDAIDREVVVSYKDDYDMSLDFRLTPYGLVIMNDDVESIESSEEVVVAYNNRIVVEGVYEVELEDGQTIEVTIDEFEMK
jgi:hypothetical protein